MPTRNVYWVDLLSGAGSAEVPAAFADQFTVRMVSSVDALIQAIQENPVLACVFEFDYPDRRSLDTFARFKEDFPWVPVVMVTLQHSETMAKWAFRSGALDFLVHPLSEIETEHCVRRLQKIDSARSAGGKRVAIRHTKPVVPPSVPGAPRSKQDRLAPAVSFVQHNYSQRISSDRMARLCDMSASHFSREFKSVFGLTFQEFLLRFRVAQACEHFDGRPVNIADVAFSVGFSDPSYFTRIFKRYVGVAPSEYVAANDDHSHLDPVRSVADIEADGSTSQVVKILAGRFGS
jgi:AraC-like DNA-binding protein